MIHAYLIVSRFAIIHLCIAYRCNATKDDSGNAARCQVSIIFRWVRGGWKRYIVLMRERKRSLPCPIIQVQNVKFATRYTIDVLPKQDEETIVTNYDSCVCMAETRIYT